jgi:hypothetical protein
MLNQIFAKEPQRSRLDPEDVADRLISQRKRAIFQKSLRSNRFEIGGGAERQVVPGAVEHSNVEDLDFASGLCAVVEPYTSAHLNHIFGLQPKLPYRFRRRDTLYLCGAVFQNYESRFAQYAEPGDPTAEEDFSLDEFRKAVNEDALVCCGVHCKNLRMENFCWSHGCGGTIQLPANAGA